MDGTFVTNLAMTMIAAFVSGYSLTWLARIVAPRLGLVDKPDGGRKCHARPTPVLGGVAFFLGFLGCTYLLGPLTLGTWFDQTQTLRICASGALFCILGVVDDKWALRPRTKFLGQLIASLPFALGAHSINTIEFLSVEVRLGMFGILFVLFWLTACANIVNLIDGLDGLASTIGTIALLTIAGLSLNAESLNVGFLAIVAASCLAGFLMHNWPPAKIFLGDAGSLTIGFLAGALALEASVKKATVFTLTIPLVVMSVPAFDTLMAILRRRLTGRRIGDGDRGHIHHRLQDKGLSKLQTLLTIGVLSVAMALVAVVAARMGSDIVGAVGCLVVLALVVASRLFGDRETRLVLQHLHALQELALESLHLVSFRFLLARAHVGDEKQRQQLWSEACTRIARMGVVFVEISGQQRSGIPRFVRREWGTNGEDASATTSRFAGSRWSLHYQVTRTDGWEFFVTGQGSSTPEDSPPRTEDLFRLFHSLCLCFPMEELGQEAPEVLQFPRVEKIGAEENGKSRAA